MNAFELPALDETRCVGCGDCVVLCPTDCLEMAGALPWLPRPGHCISCGVCVCICPVQALAMEPAASA
jgi:MinD superfamily P-loop ATPase